MIMLCIWSMHILVHMKCSSLPAIMLLSQEPYTVTMYMFRDVTIKQDFTFAIFSDSQLGHAVVMKWARNSCLACTIRPGSKVVIMCLHLSLGFHKH